MAVRRENGCQPAGFVLSKEPNAAGRAPGALRRRRFVSLLRYIRHSDPPVERKNRKGKETAERERRAGSELRGGNGHLREAGNRHLEAEGRRDPRGWNGVGGGAGVGGCVRM